MTGIVAHTYPEWWLKLAGQVAHWSTDYSKNYGPDEERFHFHIFVSNITAKLQQWIVGYPDGSEYNFLFDGTK